jgi:hypothetical protein
MKMFALLAMIVLAASAAPAPARCHPIARARLATARVARLATAPVRFVAERRPHLIHRTVVAIRGRW